MFFGTPCSFNIIPLKKPLKIEKKTIFQGCKVFRKIFDDMEKPEKLNIKCKPFSFFLR